MSNPTGPDQDAEPTGPEHADETAEPGNQADTQDPEPPESGSGTADEQATEVMAVQQTPDQSPTAPAIPAGERRFTAPSGFDAGSTEIIDRAPEPATEIFNVAGTQAAGGSTGDAATEPIDGPKTAVPQEIPPRSDAPKPPRRRRSWGWVLALILVIAALAAVAVLGTVLITRNASPSVSQEDLVRRSIQNFDTAIQKGDLSTLRTITCGETADGYNKYDDRQWADTHARVAAARQYPVVASIDQVVVNGEHAEANVTTFMAFDPGTRSTRSFDLEFRDEHWKICQAPGS